MKLRLAVILAALVCSGGQALAHHSFSAEYDINKVKTIKGVITKVEWTNPHVRFYVDAKDEKGAVTSWDLELQSLNTLTRAGWNKYDLKVGETVTVTAYLAIDGTNRGNARGNITLADGRQVMAGDAGRTGQEVQR
jgi:hypothetical protein